MVKAYTQEEIDTIKLMRSEGCSWIVIGQRIGDSPSNVRSYAARHGIAVDNLPRGGYNALRRIWAESEDDIILKGCLLGKTWQAIAEELSDFKAAKISRNMVIERGRRLNARQRAREAAPPPVADDDDPADDTERCEALPPGHPSTWDVLLTGCPYPNLPAREEKVMKVLRRSRPINPPTVMHLCYE